MSDPNALIPPPLTPAGDVDAALASTGFAVVGPQGVEALVGAPLAALDAWLPYWDRLPPDAYLLDGGKYRQRRHGAFVVDGEDVTAAPPRPHWQPVDYNALHGGIERHFEQIEPGLAGDATWRRFLVANLGGFVVNRGVYAFLVTVWPVAASEPVIAVFAGCLAGMMLNFNLSRKLVFR